jgi:hypothetical protein
MHNTIILDVRPVSYDDAILVRPDNSAKPDTYLFSESDAPDYGSIIRFEQGRAGDLSIHMHNNIGN